MKNSGERGDLQRLVLALLVCGLGTMIVGVLLASLLVDPARHFRNWLAVFSLVVVSGIAIGGYFIVRRLKTLTHLMVEEHFMPGIAPAVRTPDADELFRAVADTASDGIISADQNGNIIYWNKAAERIFMYSASEVRGRPLTFLMPDRLRSAHQEGIKRVVATGESRLSGKITELVGVRKNGMEFPLELSLSTWTTSEGRGFTGIIRDITQRKHVERRLAAEHTVTRLLAESPTLEEATPKILQAICESLEWEMGAFWSVDEKAGVLRCSEIWHSRAVNIQGFAASTKQTALPPGTGLPGRVWASGEPTWIPDVLKDANFPRAPLAAKEGFHGAFGFPIQRPGSMLGVMEFFSRKIQEPDENLLQMLSAIGSQIGQFIERKRAEQRISALKEYVQMILDSVPDPIMIINEEGQVQYINGASDKAFNLQHMDIRGYTLFDLLKADDATHEQLVKELRSSGRSQYEASVLSLHQAAGGGTLRDPLAPPTFTSEPLRRKEIKFGHCTYQYTCFPVESRSDEGKLMGLVFRDTTEESSLQDQLIQAEKLAGIALLTSGLGHELNNPLYSILGFGEAILDEGNLTVIKEHARNIVEESKRMGRIIKDLTGRSRFDASDLRVEVDINEQLSHALTLTLFGQPEGQLQIEKNYRATCKMWANPFELRQVFVNVISNAIQAMKGKGKLELATHMDADTVTVSIRDSGPGIPAPHRSKIFDPFFTTKSQGEGTGLGLTIARRIVIKHGGQIRVETADSPGASFTITFPLSDTRK
jgi:PAS domain S-box-containing protein